MSDRTPPGIHRAQPGKRSWLLPVLGVVAGLALIVILVSAFNSGGGRSPDGRAEAIAQCEARVENLLKAPATAEFSSEASSDSGIYTVTGHVDSENSFGASVRSTYQCTVELHEDTATTTVDFVN